VLSMIASLLRPGKGAKYCDEYVSLSVCLAVCPLAKLENHTTERHQIFLCVLPMALAGSVVFLQRSNTLLCTSGFVDDIMFSIHTMGPMGQPRIKHDVMFRRSSPGGGTTWTSDNYSVWSSLSECGCGGASLLSVIALLRVETAWSVCGLGV